MKEFKFELSLSVLNHLGRNLYRNFITILGEAVSNSWDADANNIKIHVDSTTKCMTIIDDGIGMDAEDFQERFLTVGYSKRDGGLYKTQKGRPFIGRKGIGKLALLSCSKRVHIVSKKKGSDLIGGTIDNSSLDEAISKGRVSGEYALEEVDEEIAGILNSMESGTIIRFESITVDKFNSIEFIRASMALHFQFSILDPNFKVYVNGEVVGLGDLIEFTNKTQIIWNVGNFKSDFFSAIDQSEEKVANFSVSLDIAGLTGFLATVSKPSFLKIRGLEGERATLDLYVNGRLRERDLLKHFPTMRIVESYTYGQIHYNDLDNSATGEDVFTSSREGILLSNPKTQMLIKELDKIFRAMMDEWDRVRVNMREVGDPEGSAIAKPQERKARELYDQISKSDGRNKRGHKTDKRQDPKTNKDKIDGWDRELSEEAGFNLSSYAEIYRSENLFRKYIEEKGFDLSSESKEINEQRTKEKKACARANINFEIRKCDTDLHYLGMRNFVSIISKSQKTDLQLNLDNSSLAFKPMRDAVAHTCLLSENAKNRLINEHENMKALLGKLLDGFEKADRSNAAEMVQTGMDQILKNNKPDNVVQL